MRLGSASGVPGRSGTARWPWPGCQPGSAPRVLAATRVRLSASWLQSGMVSGRRIRQLGDLSEAQRQAERTISRRSRDRTHRRAFGQLILVTGTVVAVAADGGVAALVCASLVSPGRSTRKPQPPATNHQRGSLAPVWAWSLPRSPAARPLLRLHAAHRPRGHATDSA